MSATPPESVITATFGPFVTGIVLQTLFLGVFLTQVYDYFRIFPKDSYYYKGTVAALTVVSILQGVMDYKILYRDTVQFYGNFDMFDHCDWSLYYEIFVTAILGTLAQQFFLKRCWNATKSYVVLGLGVAGILTSFASGLASTIKFQGVQRLSLVPNIPVPITLWLSVTAAIDIFIALVLVFHLLRVKSHTSSVSMIGEANRLIRLTMETSSLTACIALINLILYLALPGLAWHLIPQLVMGKMYGLCVMVTLHSRKDVSEIVAAPVNEAVLEPVVTGAADIEQMRENATEEDDSIKKA